VDVKLEGAHLRRGLLKKYIPVFEENAVDDDLLNEGRRNLRDYFQTKGYFDVKVDVEQRQVDVGHRSVVYKVDLGERHKLREIVLEGNKYFNKDLIRERMEMQSANYLLLHGRFSQSMLTRDAGNVEALYRSNGFQQVKVQTKS